MVANKGFLRGKWHGVKVFDTPAAFRNFKRGLLLPGSDEWYRSVRELPDFSNGITDVGIHYALEVVLRGDAMTPVAQSAPWFGGLIDNAGYSGVAPGDTSASHSGWVESDDYSETDRPTIPFAAAATRACTATISWTMNATKTIKGIFLIDDDAKNGTTGVLFSTALFSSPPTLVNGNVLTANYSLTD